MSVKLLLVTMCAARLAEKYKGLFTLFVMYSVKYLALPENDNIMCLAM